MITIKNLKITLKKGYKILIDNFNFTLNAGDKVAIIGEEGNGKSTLLKYIFNSDSIKNYCEFDGEIIKNNLKIGYLEQTFDQKWLKTQVCDYFFKSTFDSQIDYDMYNNLNEISEVLSNLHINSNILHSNQIIETLSGGEKVKIQLAKIFMQKVDVLLLDEPTNDLDIKTLMWLEEFINNCDVPIMYISHDETLLENTANIIIHIEQLKKKSETKYTIEKIPYKEYVHRRLNMIEHQDQVARKQRAEYKSQMEKFRQIYQKVEYQQDTITRADPHGAALLKKKIKSLKSQEKRYEKNKDDFLDIPDPEEAINVNFNSNIYIPSDKIILDLNIKKLEILEKTLSENIKLQVNGPEHVVIIGNNGIGKTTLIKIIYDFLKTRIDIKVGYMPQNYEDLLDLNKTAVDFVKINSSKDETTKAMTYLGAMKFVADEMQRNISELSGGQKAKLLILKLILSDSDVLILDEPTRNLSPLSNPVIRKILSGYNGTIISISHDRKFIREVCNKLYELTPHGLKEYFSVEDLIKLE